MASHIGVWYTGPAWLYLASERKFVDEQQEIKEW